MVFSRLTITLKNGASLEVIQESLHVLNVAATIWKPATGPLTITGFTNNGSVVLERTLTIDTREVVSTCVDDAPDFNQLAGSDEPEKPRCHLPGDVGCSRRPGAEAPAKLASAEKEGHAGNG